MADDAGDDAGVLVLAATPIGRVADAPPRLADELAGADVVAAEDTRRLRRLCADLCVTVGGRVVSYFEGNEAARTPALVEALLAGERVVLVTDAGMPSVSDPGYRLVAAAVEAGVRVTAVPGTVGGPDGPRGVGAAGRPVRLRGLPAPQGGGAVPPARRGWPTTSGRWSSSRRRTARAAALEAMAAAFGADRPAAVCRELTKTHEEVARGPLADLVTWAADGVRGEVTIVVAGAPPYDGRPPSPTTSSPPSPRPRPAGSRARTPSPAVARAAGVPKRDVYNLVHASGDT